MSDRLTKRHGVWQFVRRVPEEYVHLDRAQNHKHSTKIAVAKDRHGVKARKIADAMDRALEAYWGDLSEGKERKETKKRYLEAIRRARTLGRDPAGMVVAAPAKPQPTLSNEILARLERLELLIQQLVQRDVVGHPRSTKA